MGSITRVFVTACLVAAAMQIGACVQAKPPTDTGDPLTPTSPTSPTSGGTTPTPPTSSTGPFAYDPDLKAVFAADCVLCHGGVRVDGNYRMTTYAEVMRGVVAGNAQSPLVTSTRSRGSMYRYFSGSTATRQQKSDMVYSWVVNDKAQQTR